MNLIGDDYYRKIIARASSMPSVAPDDVVFVKVDKLMVHDVSGPGVIKVFEEWAKKGCPP